MTNNAGHQRGGDLARAWQDLVQARQDGRQWVRQHPIWTVVIALASVPVLAAVISGAVAGIKGTPPAVHHPAAAVTRPAAVAPAAAATTAAPTPAPTPTQPAPTVTRTVTRIGFKITGIGEPSITYGSDSDSISPPGGLGLLGDGNSLPFRGWIRYHSSALYWAVSAQLEGSGDIRCEVIVKVTKYWSDGTRRSGSKVIAHGHAAGGYNICDAQFNND